MKFLDLEGLKIFTSKVQEILNGKVDKETLETGFTWGELKKEQEVDNSEGDKES